MIDGRIEKNNNKEKKSKKYKKKKNIQIYRKRHSWKLPCVGCSAIQGNGAFCNATLCLCFPLVRIRNTAKGSYFSLTFLAASLSSQPFRN